MPAIGDAIIGMSQTDACDYAQDRIRINRFAAGEVLVTKGKPEFPERMPLPRKGNAEELSNTVMWLSSPDSAGLTGTRTGSSAVSMKAY